MTTEKLRDLLHDQVADVTAPDLSDVAWRQGRRVRRRRAWGVVAGAAAASVAVVATVSVLGGPSSAPPPDPATSTPSPTGAASPSQPASPAPSGAPPDARLDGAPVYAAPTLEPEVALPVMDLARPPLPEVIDLSVEATPVESDPIEAAAAAYAVLDDVGGARVLLVVDDGSYRSLDVTRLRPVTHEDGYQGSPLGQSMLSPTGAYLQFPQDGHLMVYDLGRSEWRRIETGGEPTADATWANDTQVYLRPRPDGGEGAVYDVELGESSGRMRYDAPDGGLDLGRLAAPYGRYRTGPAGEAQSWYSDVALSLPGGRVEAPELLVATGPTRSVLAFGDRAERWKECCPVAGWVTQGVIAFESRRAEPRLLAWWVGSHRVETVSRIVGVTAGEETFVGSYARWWR